MGRSLIDSRNDIDADNNIKPKNMPEAFHVAIESRPLTSFSVERKMLVGEKEKYLPSVGKCDPRISAESEALILFI